VTARAQDVSAMFVAEKRRLNASWSAIARMAGVSETALRRHHDDTFGSGFVDAVRKDARSDREKVRDALVGRGLSFDQAVILSRMWIANGARKKSIDLAAGIGGGEAAGIAVRDALRVGKRLGLSQSSAGSSTAGVGYALTAASVVALSKLAGLGQDRPSQPPNHPAVRP
jgi:hypothetical protein